MGKDRIPAGAVLLKLHGTRPIYFFNPACFLPDVLIEAISEFEGIGSETVYQTKTREDTPDYYSLTIRSGFISIVFAIAIFLSAAKWKWLRRISDIISGLVWLFMGVLAIILLFMMIATNHNVTCGNWNILIISPMVLALSFLHFSSLGRKERRKGINGISRFMLLVALTMFIIKGCLLDFMIEDNLSYYIFAFISYSAELVSSALSLSHSIPPKHPRYVLGQ